MVSTGSRRWTVETFSDGFPRSPVGGIGFHGPLTVSTASRWRCRFPRSTPIPIGRPGKPHGMVTFYNKEGLPGKALRGIDRLFSVRPLRVLDWCCDSAKVSCDSFLPGGAGAPPRTPPGPGPGPGPGPARGRARCNRAPIEVVWLVCGCSPIGLLLQPYGDPLQNGPFSFLLLPRATAAPRQRHGSATAERRSRGVWTKNTRGIAV